MTKIFRKGKYELVAEIVNDIPQLIIYGPVKIEEEKFEVEGKKITKSKYGVMIMTKELSLEESIKTMKQNIEDQIKVDENNYVAEYDLESFQKELKKVSK